MTTLLGTDQAAADTAMASGVYAGITVAYYSTNQSRTIAGVARDFKIIIEGNGKDGLKPGDLLVVNGQRNLDDGTPVRIRRQIDSMKELDR